MFSSHLRAMHLINWQVRDPTLLPYAKAEPVASVDVRDETYCWIIGTPMTWLPDLLLLLGQVSVQQISVAQLSETQILAQDWVFFMHQPEPMKVATEKCFIVPELQSTQGHDSGAEKRRLWQEIAHYVA